MDVQPVDSSGYERLLTYLFGKKEPKRITLMDRVAEWLRAFSHRHEVVYPFILFLAAFFLLCLAFSLSIVILSYLCWPMMQAMFYKLGIVLVLPHL